MYSIHTHMVSLKTSYGTVPNTYCSRAFSPHMSLSFISAWYLLDYIIYFIIVIIFSMVSKVLVSGNSAFCTFIYRSLGPVNLFHKTNSSPYPTWESAYTDVSFEGLVGFVCFLLRAWG